MIQAEKDVIRIVIGKLEKMKENLPKTVGIRGGADNERIMVHTEISTIIGTLEGLTER